MSSERAVYVKRGDKYQRIPFDALAINEPFILCEPDGTPVGHYVAASSVFKLDGVSAVQTLEVR